MPSTIRWRVGVVALCALCVLIAAVLWVKGRKASLPQPGAAQRVSEIHLPSASDEIACPAASSAGAPLVILVLGQSNAANQGSGRGRSSQGALWFDGHCYPVSDPLGGGTGTGGSIWSRLAPSLRDPSNPRDLVIAVLAVDSSSASDWTHEGALSDQLRTLTGRLRESKLDISAVLWQQGEAEARAGTSREAYAAALDTLIRHLRDEGISAPIFLAQSTRCRNSGSNDIRNGAALVTMREAGVFLGPDTDLLGDEYRYDGCHFNSAGLRRAADAWREVLQLHGIVPRFR